MLLNCHTYFSFCYGTLSVNELFDQTEKNGYNQLVISDINNTSAILDAIRLCSPETENRRNLKIIPGIDFRNGISQQYIGIARNNEGYQELNEHLSYHLHSKTNFNERAPEFNHAYVIYPFSKFNNLILRENEYIGISSKELRNLPFSPARNYIHKMVVLQAATFANKKHFNVHRLLRAVDQNVLLSMLPSSEQTSEDEMMLPKEKLYETFKTHPQIIANTEHILNDCSVNFAYGKLKSKNLAHYKGSLGEDMALLRSECMGNLHYRYKDADKKVYDRLEKELEVIEQKQFASYYLINWDITKYARHKGYYYVGRGSGANSIVAYLLRITDVDPVDLDLYFERFINMYRANAPDFDIDFSWNDRDDMTDYIFDRFGKDENGKDKNTVALLGTYSTFKSDSVTRELGKVFGLPPGEIDRLQNTKNPKSLDHISKLVLKYGNLIHDFPSHLSIHSSGLLISQEPVTAYSATFMPPKGYQTTQFSMLEAEDIGLFKFDILSQRGLGKIKDSLSIIKENANVTIDIHDTKKFMNDEEVKNLLRVGKCIGCFYIESPAMRMLLAKLQADDYLRLVAASSIIRPGVSKSGMMREYILRYRDEEKRKQAEAELPELYETLKETFGVMVYQEDVIKIAHEFANLTLAEADYLRRGMSWKFKQRNEFHVVRENFFNNCYLKGHPHDVIEKIWTQIESFANFAFSKGHSASYAVESYQALYLKTYFPLEYMVATLNNGGGFYPKEIYIHEARMHGAEIIPPCINTSDDLCRIIGKTIYLGFSLVGSLEKNVRAVILSERNANGTFSDLYDFIKRVPVSIEQIHLLIRIGAFAFTRKNKKELLWEAHMLINPVKKKISTGELFDVKPQEYQLPKLENTWVDNAFDERELLGFSLCSPFKLLKDKITSKLKAKDLKKYIGKTVEIIGYLVTTKNTQTSKGERMYFGTFLDSEGYWIDTVHFPPSAKAFPFTGPGCYRLIGKVEEEFDFLYIDIEYSYRLTTLNKDDDEKLIEERSRETESVSVETVDNSPQRLR